MRRMIFGLFTCLIFINSRAQNIETKIAGNNAYLKYPSDYNDSVKKLYPVMIYFPGFYEFGNDITKLLVHGPSKYAAKGEKFEFIVNNKLEKPIVISVLTTNYYSPSKVDAIINDILAHYRVDKKRVYVTGFGAGGSNWMKYMDFKPEFTSKIAGTVLISPQPTYASVSYDSTPGYKPKYFTDAGVKYWGMCGTNDYIWKEQTAFADSLNARKPYSAFFTDFKGFGHMGDFWDRVYDPNWRSSSNHKSIYEWLLAINQP